MIDTELKYFFDSVKGTGRRENEDNQLIIDDESSKLFFLFDGVGGSSNGKKATILAIDFIKANYNKYFTNGDYDTQSLFLNTNSHILRSPVSDALTTISCLIILFGKQKKVIVSNLGDTRVYCFTTQTAKQISIDDRFPLRENVITKCLGMKDLLSNDVHKFILEEKNQNYLLCTDGFYNLFEREKLEFLKVLNSENNKFVQKKINKLVEGKNSDDSSFIVVYP